MRLDLKIAPNAKQERMVAEGGGHKVYLPGPAADGKANAYLMKFLAGHLKVRKSAVRLVRGEASRHKAVEIEGL